VVKQTATLIAVVSVGALSGCDAPEADIGLYDALRTQQLEPLQTFLADGGDANGVIENTPMGVVTPLKVAVYGQSEKLAIVLLRAGARKDLAGLSLSDFASKGMDQALAMLLKDKGSSADSEELRGAIETSVSFGYYGATEVLLTHLRDTNGSPTVSLSDALNLAIGRGYDDIARLLLEHGAPASGAALRAASLRSSPGLVRFLLSRGADFSEQYRDPLGEGRRRNGYTAIEYAWDGYQRGTSAQQRIATFKIHDLMAAGADSTKFDVQSLAVDGDSLLAAITEPSEKLVRAAEWGMYDAVRASLSAIREPEALRTATIVAIDARWDDIARLLLESGAPPDGGPLHMAVRRSSPGLVRYLLELGADPNESVAGFTAAQYWWKNDPGSPEKGPLGGGTPEILYELIAAGADVCWLGAHRDELAEHSTSLSTLLNAGSKCWPQDGAVPPP
jgi:ankyrin repeat protein